jgi:hypothetical protein
VVFIADRSDRVEVGRDADPALQVSLPDHARPFWIFWIFGIAVETPPRGYVRRRSGSYPQSRFYPQLTVDGRVLVTCAR